MKKLTSIIFLSMITSCELGSGGECNPMEYDQVNFITTVIDNELFSIELAYEHVKSVITWDGGTEADCEGWTTGRSEINDKQLELLICEPDLDDPASAPEKVELSHGEKSDLKFGSIFLYPERIFENKSDYDVEKIEPLDTDRCEVESDCPSYEFDNENFLNIYYEDDHVLKTYYGANRQEIDVLSLKCDEISEFFEK